MGGFHFEDILLEATFCSLETNFGHRGHDGEIFEDWGGSDS